MASSVFIRSTLPSTRWQAKKDLAVTSEEERRLRVRAVGRRCRLIPIV